MPLRKPFGIDVSELNVAQIFYDFIYCLIAIGKALDNIGIEFNEVIQSLKSTYFSTSRTNLMGVIYLAFSHINQLFMQIF